MANPFVHVELNTTDPAKARDFYGKLLDWKLEDMQMPDGSTYTMIGVGEDGTGGGIMKHPMGGPSVWVPYILVDDLEAATQKAKSLGGNVIQQMIEVQNMGWFSIVLDPTGAVFGLWKTKNP